MKSKDFILDRLSKINDCLAVITEDDERRKELLREQSDLYDKLISIEKNEADIEYKKDTIEAENKRERTRNRITIGTYIGTTVVGVIMSFVSLHYESFGTYTTSVGKAGNNSFISKVFGK